MIFEISDTFNFLIKTHRKMGLLMSFLLIVSGLYMNFT